MKSLIPLISICLAFLVTILLYACEGSLTDPQAGPAEERILFIKYVNTTTEVCSIRPDGTGLQTIASHNSAGEFTRQGFANAKWSPDKSLIVIMGGPNDHLDLRPLWLMDNQGDLLYRLSWNGSAPNWSSDGNEILFGRRPALYSFLVDYYIINIHTLNERIALKADTYCWSSAKWSADGNYVLTCEEYFWYDEEGKHNSSDQEVVLLNLSNGERRLLTDNDVNDASARWSPDESKIAYVSGGYILGYQIKLMNSDGSGKTTLVDTLAGYNSPEWSPSGDKIVFHKRDKFDGWINYATGSDLFVLDINSGTTKQLTHFNSDSIDVFSCDWK